jgi:exodeoxyribonuclease-3
MSPGRAGWSQRHVRAITLKLAGVLFVTWNVNSLRARLPRVLELLETHQPDVVALQETKCSPANFPALELAQAGYEAVQSSGGQWAGVALLARRPLSLKEPVLELEGDSVPLEARWCEATVEGVRFVSTYVPNGRTLESPEYPRKLEFLAAAADRAETLRTQAPDRGLLIAGDINIAPADADVYNPAAYVGATHVSEPERSALASVMERGGLVDSYRVLEPDATQFTWWDYRAGNFHKNVGMRIDLALIDRELADRLLGCSIDRDFRKGLKPSDHAPLLVRFGAALQ